MTSRNILMTIGALCVAGMAPAYGQYDQDINVEGRYVPEYISHNRIAMFPVPVRPQVDASSLQYALGGVNADFLPQAVPVVATGWNITRDYDNTRGYVDFGIGSWLNSTLSAGYRFVDSETTHFGVRLQHNSTSLWRPDMAPSVSKTRRHRYDEVIGLYGSHSFSGKGTLSAAADYHLGAFNYYGFNPLPELDPEPSGTNINAPTQTLQQFNVRLDWMSPRGESKFGYTLGAAYHYTGMRRLYFPDATDLMLPDKFRGAREHDAAFNVGISARTASFSWIGADAEAHLLSYSGYDAVGTGNGVAGIEAPATYGEVTLTPYYRYAKQNLLVKLGARIDLALNARNFDGTRYRTFSIAPDVRLDYASGIWGLFVHFGGGNELNTLSARHQTDYYSAPAIFATAPAYSPLDVKAGIDMRLKGGFHAGLRFAYNITDNQRIFGWYQSFLNAQISGADYLLQARGYDLKGFSVGLKTAYDAGRYFRLDAEGSYQPQNGDKGYFTGFDRARWTASASIASNPWSSLKFLLGLDFRGVRALPMIFETPVFAGGETSEQSEGVEMYRLPHYVSLNLGVSYDITKKIGVWLQADNLTNRTNVYAPSLTEPGITVAVGVTARF